MDLFRASLRLPKISSISGSIWEDTNYDGLQALGEDYVKDVKVSLVDEFGRPVVDYSGQPVAPITVGEDGSYKFPNLGAGKYRVIFEKPEG